MLDWVMAFVRVYNKDLEGAKFKIGQAVHFIHSGQGDLGICHVVAVNEEVSLTGSNFEYALDGIDCLAWESELTAVESEEEGTGNV